MATIRIRKDRKGNGAYHVLDYTDKATGKRREQILGKVGTLKERELKRILEKAEAGQTLGVQILGTLPAQYVPTFDEYANEVYIPWHAREYPESHTRTRQIIEQHLAPEFGTMALDAIEPLPVSHWMQKRRFAKAKANTIAKELRTLKAVINHARIMGKVLPGESAIKSVKSPKPTDAKQHIFYEPEDLAALYAHCARVVNNGHGPQPKPLHAAIWKLMANTGMRRGEALALRKAQVDKRRNELTIISTGEERTKSGESRTIPITAGAAEALAELSRDVPGEYVLPRYHRVYLSRLFAEHAAGAGIGGSLHALRHTYISLLVRDHPEVAMRTVQLWAGHADLSTTMGYMYLRDKGSDEVRAINW